MQKAEDKDNAAELREYRQLKRVEIDEKRLDKEAAHKRALLNREKERKKQRVSAKGNELERELARRTLVRRRLIYFIMRMQPNYIAGWMHYDICRRLEKFLLRIINGENPRIMFFTPPRHGKSEIVSKKFPAWALGLYPWLEIISASYAVSLPMGFSRHVRSLIRDPAYQTLFPETRLDPEIQNVEGWQTTKGGIYIPAGVGGGITGKGANILNIDDPIKDAEEADSETVRESVWDWYGSTAYTRLAPLSGVCVTQTRWHDDDLSGRLINQMKQAKTEIEEMQSYMMDRIEEKQLTGEHLAIAMDEYRKKIDRMKLEVDDWEIISYPAVNEGADEWLNEDDTVTPEPKDPETSTLLREKNSALHSDRFPYERLMKIKRTLQPRHWSALYQQNPVPEEGLYFKKDMIRYSQRSPYWKHYPIIIAFDLAIGKREINDWTVGVVACLDFEDRLHILDMVRGRWDTFEIVEAILDLYNAYAHGDYKPILGIERGQIEKAIGPQFEKRQRERRIYPNMADEKMMNPNSDKLARARPLQGRMQQGMVLFPEDQPWIQTIIQELLRFPGGLFDDCVDALAWLVKIALTVEPPRTDQRKKPESWKRKLDKFIRSQNGGGKDPMAA
ncbi:MAG: phage terminase large subunit [Candidatus Dadabacteria bacterium]|nr:phage terminase large subunit [Candidatus Dadabacteria bacterium]